ncbi:MAG: N-acetylmuramoyl-L-alanine amidase [bacterium]
MRNFLILILALFFLKPVYAEINKIEANADRGFDYLDIYSTQDVKAKGLLLENKLVLDFTGAKISPGINISRKTSKRVKNIRAYQFNKETARIVIDLKQGIEYDLVHVFGRGKIVVEISDRLDEAEKIIAAWEAKNLNLKSTPLKSQKCSPRKGQDLSLLGKVIIIDPGHGGKDPGATSVSGIKEKELTLQTAKQVVEKLTAAGATVYLTRGGDDTSNLKEIVAFTNQIRPHLFISIHYNYASQEKIAGTETYYYTSQSRKLALAVHQALASGLGRRDRGLRKEMFYAIHHAKVPAILIEPLYLSNYNEEKLARSSSFQENIAKQITIGVKNYFRNR